jgi:hypothetical protein
MGRITGTGDPLLDKWAAAMTRQQETGKLWRPGQHEQPRTGDQVTRPRASRLQRKSGASTALDDLRSVLKSYKRHGHLSLHNDGGRTCLDATGKLKPAQVRAELRRAGVDERTFRTDLFNVLRINVRDEIVGVARKADAALARVQRDPAGLLSLLETVPVDQREKTLRSLGIDKQVAARIARAPSSSTQALRDAAAEARGRLSAVRLEGNLGALLDRHTRSMFDLFEPVVKRFGIGEGSFADQVRDEGLQRCVRAEKIDGAMKVAVGIVGAFAGGFLAPGVWLGMGVGAGSAAITGAPDLLAAKQDLEAAKGADALGTARKGAVGRAQQRFHAALFEYFKGVAIGAAGGSVNGALSARVPNAPAPIAGDLADGALAASMGADAANRGTDALVDRHVAKSR